MALEMKAACERCGGVLAPAGGAFVCSYECTFCPGCAAAMGRVCPNCRGELVARPRRGAAAGGGQVFEVREGGFVASDDAARLDMGFVHEYLARSYWSPGVPMEIVRRAAEHSVVIGAYEARDGGGGERQVGYARVVTDRATFAYLCDVFVTEAARGRGVSSLLMRAVMGHPALQGLRRWMLVTRDAHGLYEKFGFVPTDNPQNVMTIVDRDIYRRSAAEPARADREVR